MVAPSKNNYCYFEMQSQFTERKMKSANSTQITYFSESRDSIVIVNATPEIDRLRVEMVFLFD